MRTGRFYPPRRFLSLCNATFRLGDRLVLCKTSWTFQQGEHWAVLGPNGGGKSLFGDALRGALPLVQGELLYHFRPPPGRTAEQSLGHVSFEERRLNLHETVVQSRWNSLEQDSAVPVREFLSYETVMEINPYEVTPDAARARHGFARRLARVSKLLELDPFYKRALLSLSNGERQRVQLARALCQPLRLLILDEPFAGLDTRNRVHFRRILERLMAGGLPVLVITTRIQDLPRHITHALWLEDCRVLAAGRLADTEISARINATLRSAKSRWFSPPAATKPAETNSARLELDGDHGRPLVELRNITVRYGVTVILHNLNWRVRAGESWALLGPNGSGKTTLLSLIQGDHPQAYGNEVRVFGKRRGPGESIWQLKQRIGSVSPELHVHFDSSATCFDVVASGFRDTIGLFQPVTPSQRATVLCWLRRFDLAPFADTELFALSTGQQRMTLLARALVKHPPLLLLDEPCQGLDAPHRELFIRTVNDLVQSGLTTVIYVTHRTEEIPPAIQRVLRLRKTRALKSS
ncbi:MAG TPA: ATP-binding cassette domain-containing protein [Verrucomicrobiae bacterium]|nr:ATP-binding cassette domain-containing protein [Verrucomicrobiae bacterium]